jgi:hypothetical protein
LARFSDTFSAAPLGVDTESWTSESQQNIPLCLKMESVLHMIMHAQIQERSVSELMGNLRNETLFKFSIEYDNV